MSPPRTLALDLMDTVVRDPFREALRAGTGRPLQEVLAHKDPMAWPRFERGELTEEEYFSTFGDLSVDVEAFHRARREGYAWMPGMRALLADLEGLVERVTASNYPVWVDELARDLLADHFDRVIASCHLGVRKPDLEFYERLCAHLGRAATEVLLVDDREDNVEGALAAGLRAHLFTDAEDLRARLQHEGLAIRRRSSGSTT